MKQQGLPGKKHIHNQYSNTERTMIMKEYKIKMMDHAPMCEKCWSRIEKAEIDECVWMDDYKPHCYA